MLFFPALTPNLLILANLIYIWCRCWIFSYHKPRHFFNVLPQQFWCLLWCVTRSSSTPARRVVFGWVTSSPPNTCCWCSYGTLADPRGQGFTPRLSILNLNLLLLVLIYPPCPHVVDVVLKWTLRIVFIAFFLKYMRGFVRRSNRIPPYRLSQGLFTRKLSQRNGFFFAGGGMDCFPSSFQTFATITKKNYIGALFVPEPSSRKANVTIFSPGCLFVILVPQGPKPYIHSGGGGSKEGIEWGLDPNEPHQPDHFFFEKTFAKTPFLFPHSFKLKPCADTRTWLSLPLN